MKDEPEEDGDARMGVDIERKDTGNIISDDDDDESYVPESLRDFLKAADKKLEEDLSFLSPPEQFKATLAVADNGEDYDNGEDDGENSIVGGNDIAAELQKAKQRDLKRAAAMEQESRDQRERDEIKIDQNDLEEERQQQQRSKTVKLATTAMLSEEYEEEVELELSSPLLDIIHPSADVSERHLKQIAMEGADEDGSSHEEEEGLQPLVAMFERKTANLPAPSPMIDGGVATLDSSMTDTERSRGNDLMLSPPSKVGRKLQMELDAEAHRASLPSSKPNQKEHNNNGVHHGPDNMSVDINSSFVSYVSHESSVEEKRARLKELQSKSVQRRNRLKELEDKANERKNLGVNLPTGNGNGERDSYEREKKSDTRSIPIEESIQMLSKDIAAATKTRDPLPEQHDTEGVTPSVAAAAAASKAAAVVARSDEGPIAMPDAALIVATKESTTMQRKLAMTGPVKALPSQRRPTPPKWNFRKVDAYSPPRPKEIITRTNISDDGGGRSVSPLGGEGAMFEGAVSPLGSSRMRRTNSHRRATPQRDYNDEDDKPLRPSPSRRRQLTRPDSAFERLSRPTETKSSQNKTKSNPEEEQRKARERIRKRMAMQRKKAKNNSDVAQHVVRTTGIASNTSAEKSKKANATKERMERIEKERLAKLKAKIEAKEERMQMKKKEETKKNKLRLRQRAASRQSTQQQHPENEKDRKTNRPMAQNGISSLTIPVAPKFATDRRLASSASTKSQTKERLSLASSTEIFGQGLRSSTSSNGKFTVAHQASRPSLTIPVAPKFATDRRLSSSESKKTNQPKEQLSLISRTNSFEKGLRSSTPPIKKSAETPGTRRLTIPMAPKFATSQRFGEKANSTPFSSPTQKKRESIGDVSWSSMLRDVSGIASPISKSASSVKTGPLTIPITPQFQPIRKRPLPKSTAEREKEELQYQKEHPFKARMVKMNQHSSSSRSKKPVPKRQLTTPEPFRLYLYNSAHKRGQSQVDKDVEPVSFKARPMPNFSSNVPSTSGKNKKKKTSPLSRPLTTQVPFKFQPTSSSRHSHVNNRYEGEKGTGKFKAVSMPDFKSTHMSLARKKLRSPPTRPLTTPEPFKLHGHSTTKKREILKSPDEEAGTKFKARPMPNFASHRKTHSGAAHSKPAKKVTKTEPFRFQTRDNSRNHSATKEQQRQKDERSKKAARSSSDNKQYPTGASGLLFHRSFTESSRLSRPRVAPQPPKQESKPFKARPMPDYIPEIIVTRTPIKDEAGNLRPHDLDQELEQELDSILSDELNSSSNFHARPMPSFDKVDIPVKNKDPRKLRTPPSKAKQSESPPHSPGFKATGVPKAMEEEPSILVRRRDPKKLRSPDSVKKLTTQPSVPKSPTFRARPVPDSLYDEPSPILKSRSRDPSTMVSSMSRESNTISSPLTSPPRIQREKQITSNTNVMEDAKARLRERLSKRRSNSAAVKATTPNRDNTKDKKSSDGGKTESEIGKLLTSPKAFSASLVQSRLNSQCEANPKTETKRLLEKLSTVTYNTTGVAASGCTNKTPKKSNSTIPNSIDLPVRSPNTFKEKRSNNDKTADNLGTTEDSTTPQIANQKTTGRRNDDIPEKEASLLRETKLALALGIPDGDESSSILQLAHEVQKAAEDELSFYGSIDTRDHWSSSLADGRPRDLL